MVLSSFHTEARRWVKFPATVLLATALLGLLHNYFNFDPVLIGQRCETGLGAAMVFLEYILIPLGSVAVALGMLSLHRWALALGYVLPLLALMLVTIEKVQRIVIKFAEYRAGSMQSLGGGVMTALLVLALWAVYGLVVLYIAKSWRMLNQAREWMRAPAATQASTVAGAKLYGTTGAQTQEGDVCLIMPEAGQEEST
jgi:hypothetical protein